MKDTPLTRRVKAMRFPGAVATNNNFKEVIVHSYDEVGMVWSIDTTLTNTDEPIKMDPNWSGRETLEFIASSLWGVDDEEDRWLEPVSDHTHLNVRTIQSRSDRGHLSMVIIEY